MDMERFYERLEYAREEYGRCAACGRVCDGNVCDSLCASWLAEEEEETMAINDDDRDR